MIAFLQVSFKYSDTAHGRTTTAAATAEAATGRQFQQRCCGNVGMEASDVLQPLLGFLTMYTTVAAARFLQAAKAHGIMCSYNAVNGTPSCVNDAAMNGLLRRGLGFDGYVVSDCNAVAALTWGHRTHATLAEASAAALKAGVDIFCDKTDGVRGSSDFLEFALRLRLMFCWSGLPAANC